MIAEGNITYGANENNVGYSLLLNTCNEFHRHGQNLTIHFLSDWHTRSLFIKGKNNDQSIIWNQNALAMWARIVDRMHALLFLLMHFTASGSFHGEEYKSYFIRNIEHPNRTLYWLDGTIMTF